MNIPRQDRGRNYNSKDLAEGLAEGLTKGRQESLIRQFIQLVDERKKVEEKLDYLDGEIAKIFKLLNVKNPPSSPDSPPPF